MLIMASFIKCVKFLIHMAFHNACIDLIGPPHYLLKALPVAAYGTTRFYVYKQWGVRRDSHAILSFVYKPCHSGWCLSPLQCHRFWIALSIHSHLEVTEFPSNLTIKDNHKRITKLGQHIKTQWKPMHDHHITYLFAIAQWLHLLDTCMPSLQRHTTWI